MDVSVGRLHPELRDMVLRTSLWICSLGGSSLLLVVNLGNPAFDPWHPVFLLMAVLHATALVLAAWPEAPAPARSAVLGLFTLFWGFVVLAYTGPNAVSAMFFIFYTLLGGFIYGSVGVWACMASYGLIYVLAAIGWVQHWLPLKTAWAARLDSAQYWVASVFAVVMGTLLVCGVVYYLVRRMSQYHLEDARTQLSLAKEQQLRAQAELRHMHAQVAQLQAEQTLASMLRSAPVGFALVVGRRLVQVNQRLCDMLGYSPAELTGMSTRELYQNEADFRAVGPEVERAVAESRIYSRELVFRTRSGGEVPVLITVAALDPAHPESGWVTTALDISGMQRAAAALRESETRLREIFDHATEIIFSLTPDATGEICLERLNRAAQRYGIDVDAIVPGQTRLKDFFSADEGAAIDTEVRRCLTERVPVQLDQTVTLAGAPVRFQTTLVPIIDATGGAVVRIVGLSHDVTAQHQMEEMRAARAAADAASKAKSAFLSSMSHEIRTPLNAVLGFTHLLIRDNRLDGKQREFLRTIARNGEHLLNLINDILEISKIEAAHVELRSVDFSPVELCRDIVSTFQPRTDAKAVKLHLDVAPDVPALVSADEGKLRQILLNLVGNAVKFIERGEIRLRLRADGGLLEMAVIDTGPGIAEAEQARLFQNFEQTELGRRVGGSGLGLVISRNYARLMGGDITLVSAEGVGSTFHLRLPVVVRSGPEAAGPAARDHLRSYRLRPSNREVRLLVVDDVVDNRTLLRSLLAEAGFSIREASDGRQAVEITETWSPHCILMDMKMPTMDGPTAVQQIRARHASSEIKIVSLSASVFEEEKGRFMDGGADAFLPKPVNQRQLFETLGGLLGVEYEAAVATPESPAETASAPADGEAGRDLRRRISEAAEQADYSGLRALLEELWSTDPALARDVDGQLQRFDYESIQALVHPPMPR